LKEISNVLKVNYSITNIRLSYNHLSTTEGLRVLADALKINSYIEHIDLIWWNIDVIDVENILIDSLQYNYSIKSLITRVCDNNRKIDELLKPENRKQRIIEWMPWKNHHICIKLEPRFHDIILTLLYLFFIPQIFLRREKLKLLQKKYKNF
jgi:hypothetical protein